MLKSKLESRASDAQDAVDIMTEYSGQKAQDAGHAVQDRFGAERNMPSVNELGIFMVLVFGAVALVVVSIVLLFGMDIAGEFADGINVDNEYSDAANDTVNSTGNAFQLFGTSVLVIPAAAVLAVLIGGLIGAVTMVGGGGALPGTRGGMGGR